MSLVESVSRKWDGAERFSYLFIAGVLILAVGLRLGILVLAVLFTHLALSRLCFWKRGGKWLAVGIFLVLVAAVTYSLVYFTKHTVRALPEIADKAIPSVIATAKNYEIELPFTDYDSLKDLMLDSAKAQMQYLGSFAKVVRSAGTQILFLVAGVVVGLSLFLNPRFELGRVKAGHHWLTGETGEPLPSLYGRYCEAIGRRFAQFYRSFETVMGAQIIISAVNTVLTAVFAAAVHLPYAVVVVGVTFLCGLLPVVGNLVSNTIIVSIGFTVSPKMALAALIYLVVIHKLEYFLNSKIVGRRIRNPLWLTLLGLVVGERLLGVPGMVLAPVVLHYVKMEASGGESGEARP